MPLRPKGEEVLDKVESVRSDVVGLLREKRYEEALAALYRARSESPADRELQKGIDQIKQFLIGGYAKRLGGLDRVAQPLQPASVRSPDAALLRRYIDGTSTFGDVALMCPLGQLRTLQVLVGLYCGAEPQRIEQEPPNSGLRVPEVPASASGRARLIPATDEPDSPAPETARSASVALVVGAAQAEASASVLPAPISRPQTEEDRRYNESFAAGTAAFVQLRFADAVESFEACDRLRPGDRGAEVMLRRSRRELESRRDR